MRERDFLHSSVARERAARTFARDALREARDFTSITGPRDFWLASTAVWCCGVVCIRYLHTTHKETRPIFFFFRSSWVFVGSCWSCPQVERERSVWGLPFFFCLFLRGTCFVQKRDTSTRAGRVCAGTVFFHFFHGARERDIRICAGRV